MDGGIILNICVSLLKVKILKLFTSFIKMIVTLKQFLKKKVVRRQCCIAGMCSFPRTDAITEVSSKSTPKSNIGDMITKR